MNKPPKPTGNLGDRAEEWFESYLAREGLDFSHEPKEPIGKKQPDYLVRRGEARVRCDVKHMGPGDDAGALHIDSCQRVRRLIKKAAAQLKGYRDEPCALVLKKAGYWDFDNSPATLFGATLGDPAVCIQVGADPSERSAACFTRRGSMLDPHGRPQNTTISAIVVISLFRIKNPHLDVAFREALARHPELAEAEGLGDPRFLKRIELKFELLKTFPYYLGHVKRVRVFENPFARIPLPKSIFCGEYDERYRLEWTGRSSATLSQVFRGAGLDDNARCAPSNALEPQVAEFCERVVEEYHPRRIVLFGSHARGAAAQGSDVDLLLVMPGSGDESSRSLEIRRALNPTFPLDMLVRSEGQLTQRYADADWFIRDILDDGKILYEATDARVA